MTIRTLLLVLTTTTLSALAGCATPQTAPREEAAVNTSSQQGSEQGEHKGCSCALRKEQGGAAAQAADGKGCSCPHCAKTAADTDAKEGKTCGCSHKHEGNQAQALDNVR
ncbi:hypothetical protein [Hyalangium minutum]|uniref:Lipoprotein n=1 Tax=Hyalangium minutum TaxID=394096 RepID=A0A085WGS9_9BACT|nr:hypothetical protein [Hyalangium minutum]KFE66892.1 hypothetical protein DB31_9106 [Hyalangium minutum]